MSARRIAIIEYVVLAVAIVSVFAFIGLPGPDQRLRPLAHQTRLEQGAPPWDANLVLPDSSDRIVHYTMDVTLDTATNIVRGTEILEWRNTTGRNQSSFPFHLYHNAWKNNRSTFARENGWSLRPGMKESDYGYTNITSAAWETPRGDVDILPTLTYLHPDDNNTDDQTVCQLRTPRPIPPGRTMRLKLAFETKQPLPISRTGVIRQYHFFGQWFPKIGVWWKGAWNCHQFHAHTEFFADYGVYDVNLTVPSSYIVGASGGIPESITPNANGTATHRFVQADIHDFAWVAAPDFNVHVRTFSHRTLEPGERSDRHHPLKDVKVILLTQPQHENMVDRYFDATFKALRYYGEWYGEYPYDAVTVVDPANGSRSGGMEYPTLFTGGTNLLAPAEQSSPEGVTVHEFGHQFWYGMVGNNEFEEAWLDEGFNTYSTDRVIRAGWPPFKAVRYYFGGSGAASYVGIPWIFSDINEDGLLSQNTYLRMQGKNDVMARRGWEYNESYGLNSYHKPAMSLMTLERYLGEEMMYRVMRTYQFRYRFKHPTSQDFINTVNEVTGKNMQWFFDNTWYSSNLFDYAVDHIDNNAIPPPRGVFNANGGPVDSAAMKAPRTAYVSEVVITRKGEAIAPVEVLITFEDGSTRHEAWDGRDRWVKYSYPTDVPVVSAVVDPDHKLVMDINWDNNSQVVRPPGFRSLATRRIASKFLFWVQNALEIMTYWN